MSSPEPVHPRRGTAVLGVVGALVCGAGVASQSRVNGELGAELGDGYIAALISFASGFVLVAVVTAISPAGRRGLRIVRAEVAARRMPWWYLTGGAVGALFVLSQGLVAGILGIAIFTVAVVCGQTISGMVIDARGIGTAAPRPVTVARFVGSALMLVAVVLVVSTQLSGSSSLWAVLLPLAAGMGTGWQQAFNGQVRVISGSPATATFINFVVGLVLLVIAAIVHALLVGLPVSYPTNPLLYIGGVLGAIFIGLGAILAPRIGVLLLALGTISGQLVVALLLDVVVPAAEHPLAWTTVAGTLLTLVALAIATVPFRVLSGSARR